MYENDKYNILKIKNKIGPQFEVVVEWIEQKKIEHIFMNDMYLEDDKVIERLDNIYEIRYNQSVEELNDKKDKLDVFRNKFIKKEKGGN